MNTLRQDIRDAVIAALNTSAPAGVPAATKRRFTPGGSQDKELHLSVFFVEEPNRPIGNARQSGAVQRSLHIAVQATGSSTTPDMTDDLLEPVLAWCTSVLGSTNLGGLATNVEEVTTKWEQKQADRFYIAGTAIYKIEYQSKRNDITAKQ
jgi:hypothetical protein